MLIIYLVKTILVAEAYLVVMYNQKMIIMILKEKVLKNYTHSFYKSKPNFYKVVIIVLFKAVDRLFKMDTKVL